ncbi:MAG TPA: hypothetical protein VKI17_05130 [Gemmataceae bacterium]|nr:hypothetical protein [Gemmataceae bacterium]
MRPFFRAGPLFLMLGAALTGCGQGDHPPAGTTSSPAKPSAAATTPSKSAASYDYVLAIEGMT